jgi:hypothetical protein
MIRRERQEIRAIESLIRAHLSPDLLNHAWSHRVNKRSPLTKGHCYVAAEAAYHYYGKFHQFAPKVIAHGDWTHWFLERRSDGVRLDPTADQFGRQGPPYKRGRWNGFLTKAPSKRCQILIARMKEAQ